MAPRKNSSDLLQKVVRKRVTKPVKPPLKTPTIVKVQITSPGNKPPKIERNLTTKRKIELANEVALAQLQATLTSPKSVNTSLEQSNTPSTKKNVKRTPVKRNTVEAENNSLDEFETSQELVKKQPGPKSKTQDAIKKPLNPKVNLAILPEIKKSLPKIKRTPGRKRQQKSDNSSDVLNRDETGIAEMATSTPAKRVNKRKQTPNKQNSQALNSNATPTPFKRAKGRPKGSVSKQPVNAKGNFSSKEIKAAATMLENALKISAPSSRRSSIVSNKSYMSWTKDISTETSLSSGTTTCITVKSMDIVRFDKKMPLVKMENLKQIDTTNFKRLPQAKISNDSSSSDSSDSSSSSSSSDTETDGDPKPELNLSTSSLTQKSPEKTNYTELFSVGIDNISTTLKSFYAEIRKLVPIDDKEDDLYTFSEIIKFVDHDMSVLLNNCDNFNSDIEVVCREMSSPQKGNLTTPSISNQNESDRIEDYIRQSNCDKLSEIYSSERSPQNIEHSNSCPDQEPERENTMQENDNHMSPLAVSPTDTFKTFRSDYTAYVPFDKTNDDDDALSLYAESITGVESSKNDSASGVSYQDIYVPKYSPRACIREKYVYKPTKIQYFETTEPEKLHDSRTELEEGELLSVTDTESTKVISGPCVSSSVATDINKSAMELLEDSNRISSFADKFIKKAESHISSQPRLFSTYKPINPVRSSLYRGYCFFYLANQCKRLNCRFPHISLDVSTYRSRLAALDEDALIAEYLLMCTNNSLRRFSLLFVEECKRRKASRILFEMAIDLGLRIVEIDEEIKVKILETTLLHLNTISIDACDDQLKYEHNNTMMCDALLQCMANSQNFAQFERAFAKLANLMWELKRPVDIEVVSSILERVCILPGKEILARGMLTLMKNTDSSIFKNTLAKSFEVQLSNLDSDDLHEEYVDVKNSAMAKLASRLAQAVESDSLTTPRIIRDGTRHTSPDSTNLDNMQLQDTHEPIFTRTINNEAIRDSFKAPRHPVPKRYATARPNWRRGFVRQRRNLVVKCRPNGGSSSRKLAAERE